MVAHGFQYLYAEWLSTDNALLMGFGIYTGYQNITVMKSAGTVCGQCLWSVLC